MTIHETGEVAELDVLMSRESAACLFHALSDSTRLQVVQHLLTGPHRVVDLKEHLGLAQSTVSAHVACLRDCGLLDATPVGRSTMYSLSHPVATADFLRAAEELLLVTGSAVVLCPRHAASDHNE
ncbi:MAG: metalloregulator ArsR/SmtB family transcription factor [Actinobacteria bacterium]|nr:metalloregulator ArsR/SmtB family transcription factor [Actinomycetota bacterium]